MPQTIESGNVVSSSLFSLKASELNLFGDTLVLRKVRLTYENDADGKRTNRVIACLYDTLDPDSYSEQTIKVKSDTPVITQKELKETEDTVYIQVPLEKTTIKPYEIIYGDAKVSIQAPYVELRKL